MLIHCCSIVIVGLAGSSKAPVFIFYTVSSLLPHGDIRGRGISPRRKELKIFLFNEIEEFREHAMHVVKMLQQDIYILDGFFKERDVCAVMPQMTTTLSCENPHYLRRV